MGGGEQKNIYLTEPEIFRYKNHKTEKNLKKFQRFCFFFEIFVCFRKNLKNSIQILFFFKIFVFFRKKRKKSNFGFRKKFYGIRAVSWHIYNANK